MKKLLFLLGVVGSTTVMAQPLHVSSTKVERYSCGIVKIKIPEPKRNADYLVVTDTKDSLWFYQPNDLLMYRNGYQRITIYNRDSSGNYNLVENDLRIDNIQPQITGVKSISLSCDSRTVSVNTTNFTRPDFYLYDNSKKLLGHNKSGIFNNVPYGAITAVVKDDCDKELVKEISDTLNKVNEIKISVLKEKDNSILNIYFDKVEEYTVKIYDQNNVLLLNRIVFNPVFQTTLPVIPAGKKFKVVGTNNCGTTNTAWISYSSGVVKLVKL